MTDQHSKTSLADLAGYSQHPDQKTQSEKAQDRKIVTEPTALADVEKQAILKAIENRDGNIKQAATDLGISISTVYRKLKKWESRS